jgi:hypothetical protein
VFDEKWSTLDMYTGKSSGVFDVDKLEVKLKPGKQITDVTPYALYKTFSQLESGYSIVMSAYGVSGAGKTTNYLGQGNSYGLLHYGLRNLQGVVKMELYQAFEIYYSQVIPNELIVRNKIIILYDASKNLGTELGKYAVMKDYITSENINLKQVFVHRTSEVADFIKNITDECQKHMKDNGRVKQTILNDKSSRSHLFLVFKISFASGITSYFTLCDMAGVENAFAIYNKIFTPKTSLPYMFKIFDQQGRYRGDIKKPIEHFLNTSTFGVSNGDYVLSKGDEGHLQFSIEKPRIEASLSKNIQILYESFGIVESLLHMKYFFNKRNGIENTLPVQRIERGDIQYETTRVFKQPQYEDIFSSSFDRGRVTKGHVGMVPILNYLDKLNQNSKGKTTKFVMFCALRKDKCQESKESLIFAESISTMSKAKKD